MSSTDFIKRYGKKILKTRSGCWLWNGAKNKAGYGVIRKDKKLIFAHVLSYNICYGEKPHGQVTDHLCRKRACVNPKHLEAVTQKVNVRRGLVAIKRKFCKNGHPLKEGNLYFWNSKDGYKTRACKACTLLRSKKRYQESRRVID